LAQLEEFQRARVIEICPSLAQEHLRLFSLAEGKVLLTPAPSIDNALFYKLDPKFLHIHDLSRAATKSGIDSFEKNQTFRFMKVFFRYCCSWYNC